MWRGVSWVNNGAGRPSSPCPPAQPETLLRPLEQVQVRKSAFILFFDTRLLALYSIIACLSLYRP